MKKSKHLVKPFRIEHGKDFRLKDHDPAQTAGVHSKPQAEKLLAEGIAKLADLQDKLYAQDTYSLLMVFQAMDAAGKDGTIRHVMSGVNPQGCQVQLQSTLGRGARSRLPVADHEGAAGARADWNFQSLVLRRSAGRAGAS